MLVKSAFVPEDEDPADAGVLNVELCATPLKVITPVTMRSVPAPPVTATVCAPAEGASLYHSSARMLLVLLLTPTSKLAACPPTVTLVACCTFSPVSRWAVLYLNPSILPELPEWALPDSAVEVSKVGQHVFFVPKKKGSVPV